MSRYYTLRSLGVLLATLIAAAASGASPPVKSTCEKEWAQLQTDTRFPSTATKIKQFESYAFLCAGSGLYEVQLARFYMQPETRDLGKAKQILDSALKQNLPYRKVILLNESIMYGLGQDLAHALEIDTLLIHDYPNSYEGYSGLGAVLLFQHRPKESIKWYEKANSLTPTAVAYRNLVTAYALERRYDDAINAFDQYYRRDPSALGDRDVVMTVAIAYEKEDELELADGALRGLLKTKPGVKDDKEFVALFRKVNAELGQKK